MTIAQWGDVDFIEVSGGDYEHPGMLSDNPLLFSSLTRT